MGPRWAPGKVEKTELKIIKNGFLYLNQILKIFFELSAGFCY